MILKIRFRANLLFGIRGKWMKNIFFGKQNHKSDLSRLIFLETEKAQFCLKSVVQFLSSLILSAFYIATLVITSWKATFTMSVFFSIIFLISYRSMSSFSLNVGKNKILYTKNLTDYIDFFENSKKDHDHNKVEFTGMVDKFIKTLANYRFFSLLPRNIGEILAFSFVLAIIYYLANFTNIGLLNVIPVLSLFILVINRLIQQFFNITNGYMGILSNIESLETIHKNI